MFYVSLYTIYKTLKHVVKHFRHLWLDFADYNFQLQLTKNSLLLHTSLSICACYWPCLLTESLFSFCFQRVSNMTSCDRCGGYRYVPCPHCHGSKKSLHRNHFTEEFCALRCIACDENGLVKCDNCIENDRDTAWQEPRAMDSSWIPTSTQL